MYIKLAAYQMLGTSLNISFTNINETKLIMWCDMTIKSALDILPAMVNSPFCYKLGVSAINDYNTREDAGPCIKHLHNPFFFSF